MLIELIDDSTAHNILGMLIYFSTMISFTAWWLQEKDVSREDSSNMDVDKRLVGKRHEEY